MTIVLARTVRMLAFGDAFGESMLLESTVDSRPLRVDSRQSTVRRSRTFQEVVRMSRRTRPIAYRDYERWEIQRRTLLEIGAVALAGLSLPRLLRAEAGGAQRPASQALRPRARSVILLFQFGGPSHLDTFDPKPHAPREVRGEFGTISTSVPGVAICEHLPRLAKLASRYALVRSVHHDRSSHNPGAYYSLTGRRPLSDRVTLNASATDFPHPGAVTDWLLVQDAAAGSPEASKPASRVPRFVSLPSMIADGPFRTPGEFAGLLGRKYDPLFITQDPNSPAFRVPELSLPAGVGVERIDDRRALLAELDGLAKAAERPSSGGLSEHRERAMEILSSEDTRRALDIDAEAPEVRDRYGRTTYGQSCLLARRLVEAGVRFVTVYYSRGIGGWDTHKDNFSTLRDSRLPQTDQSVSALIEDLECRGLLDETLVYWTGDFGRTPKVNKDAGRDHWPPCQTVLMAGGGIRGGRVYGASDSQGAYPDRDPVLPDDITATVYSALGFDPRTEVRDQLGRPMLISQGRPLTEILG
jgi:hypothetical protein